MPALADTGGYSNNEDNEVGIALQEKAIWRLVHPVTVTQKFDRR